MTAEEMTAYGSLSDLLLYDARLERDVLALNDGALLAGWRYQGRDLGSWSWEERRGLNLQLAKVLSLGSGWMVETNAIRTEMRDYPEVRRDIPAVARVIDEERHRQFLAPGAGFRTQLFLTVTYLPPSLRESRAVHWFMGRTANAPDQNALTRAGEQSLEVFHRVIAEVEAGLKAFFQVERLKPEPVRNLRGVWYDDRLLRYLRLCLLGVDAPFAAPRLPLYVNELFRADLTPGNDPVVAGRRVRILALDSYPAGSTPAMLEAMEALPFACRWNARHIQFDPETSKKMHDKIRREWRSAQRGLFSQLLNLGGKPDGDAVLMEHDAEDAMTVAGRGLVLFGADTTQLVLLADSTEELDRQEEYARTAIKPSGFQLRREDVNAMDALRGSWPGHGYSNIRVAPVHTLHFVEAMPTSSPYTGERWNPSRYMPPRTPALLKALTEGRTPYDLHPHAGDTPHAAIVGPTRTGKSSLLALMAAQWIARYPKGRVFAFDKKASIRTLAEAMGGRYFGLDPMNPADRLYPLGALESYGGRAWAENWLVSILRANGLLGSPQQINRISETLRLLEGRSESRSLTHFQALVAHKEIQDALQYYTCGSASGGLLDGTSDGLIIGNSPLTVFEMDQLLGLGPRIVQAVLPYLFRVIEQRLDSSEPTLILIDEAWAPLNTPVMAEEMRSWLKELAKLNAGVVLAMQGLNDAFLLETGEPHPMKHVILDQCQTRYYLANPSAAGSARHLYQDMGCNEIERQQIAEARPQRDYFVQRVAYGDQDKVFRRIELELGKVALSFVGANSGDEQRSWRTLYQQDPVMAPARWLRHRGLEDWAAFTEAVLERELRERESAAALAS